MVHAKNIAGQLNPLVENLEVKSSVVVFSMLMNAF